MKQIKPQQLSPVFSKIYSLGDISGKLTYWMDEDVGERVQLEFLPWEFTSTLIFASIDQDCLEDALFNFEVERLKFLKKHYPTYYVGLNK